MTEFPLSGHVATGFEPVRDAFEANFEDDGELGAGFAVLLDGEPIVDLLGGWADRKMERPWDAQTLVPACAAALAALPPMWPPGTAHGYHPTTWGYVVGEMFRRISGVTLGTWLRENVCAPNGVDFHIGLPASEHDRCADIKRPTALPSIGEMTDPKKAAFGTKWSSPNRGGAIWREIEIPSANGHSTAASVAALYNAYAHRGAVAGKALMPDEAFASLVRSRVDGPDLVLNMSTSFGAGIMRNTHGFFGPNPEALGHCGWGGSMAIADPDRRLTCAYVMNKQSNVLVGDPRAVALVNAVYGCL